jgi:CRP-like cAMP-binding protein
MSSLSTLCSESDFSEQVPELTGRKMHMKKNQLILINSYPFPAMFYIVKGMVRIGGYLEQESETTYCLLPEDHIFTARTHAESRWSNFAQACTDEVELRVYQEHQLKPYLHQDRPYALDLADLHQKYISSMERHAQMLACTHIHQKLTLFVLFLAELYGYRRQGITYVPHSFTHQEIGRILNISRQTITQTLRQLQGDGLLDYHRGRFVVSDYENLGEYVKG